MVTIEFIEAQSERRRVLLEMSDARVCRLWERIRELEAQRELWKKSEEGTLAQMAETNERFEGALSTIRELEAEAAESLLEGVKDSNQVWKNQYREAEARRHFWQAQAEEREAWLKKAEADAGRLRAALEWVLKEIQEKIAAERGPATATIEDYFRMYKRISVGFYDEDVAMLQAALSHAEQDGGKD